MTTLIVPVTKADDTDPGQDLAVTAAANTVVLAAGFYKIAAVGTSLKWKLGTTTAVTASNGSYLADGDQELVQIPESATADDRTLAAIRSTNSVADGSLNIVPVLLFEVPGRDARNY